MTIRPAPFVEELPAAVPVLEAPLLLAVAAAAPVAPDPVACGGVKPVPATEEAEGELTAAVLEP
jgi:hypothetical protein